MNKTLVNALFILVIITIINPFGGVVTYIAYTMLVEKDWEWPTKAMEEMGF